MISFVVVARNDNYGGDFNQRMQIFTDVLSALCIKHQLQAELVVVEWNPPEDRERLQTAIKWDTHSFYQVRIIEVSHKLHQAYAFSDRIPLYEFIGKNVGIKRARGEYIVATNPDIIFSDEIIWWMANYKLKQSTYYRATRYDVESPILEDNVLEYCKNHIIRINSYTKPSILSLLRHPSYKRPFTNASGDFTLMSKEDWCKLSGYREMIGASSSGWLVIDGILLYSALNDGMKEIRLGEPLRIYHQEHDRKGHGNIPYSVYVDDYYKALKQNKKQLGYNNANWGLGNMELSEITIGDKCLS